jgi:hypothetical protein
MAKRHLRSPSLSSITTWDTSFWRCRHITNGYSQHFELDIILPIGWQTSLHPVAKEETTNNSMHGQLSNHQVHIEKQYLIAW